MTFEDAKDKLHDRILRLRSLERTLDNKIFQDMYHDHDNKDHIHDLIARGDNLTIEQMVEDHKEQDLSKVGVRRLRYMAIRRKIKGASKMSTYELIEALENDRN